MVDDLGTHRQTDMNKQLGLGLILGVAAVGRLLGSSQGYPDFYGHVDEIGVAASIWNFFRDVSLRPTEFTYPALYSYIVASVVACTGIVVAGSFPGAGFFDRLTLLSYTDPAWSALMGRGVSLVSDMVHVVVIHRLSWRVGAGRWAWFGALAYAVALVPVRQAHMALPDATVALLSTLVVYRAWTILEGDGEWRDYLVAGAVCGLVVATKYNGALCALAVVGAHLQRASDRAWWQRCFEPRLWGAGAIAVVIAALACPYFVLAPEQYFGLARYQLSSLGFALKETSPWWWIAREWVLQEFVLGGLLLAGVVWASVKRDRYDWLVLATVVPAFAYIGSWTRESLHYLLPYLGILIVQVTRMWAHTERRMRVDGSRLLVVIALATLLPNTIGSLHASWQMQRIDTRTLAATWIKRQVPDGTGIGMTWLPYCPRLPSTQDSKGLAAAYGRAPEAINALHAAGATHPAYDIVNLEVWLKQPSVPESLRQHIDLDDRETRRVFSRGWRSPRQLWSLGVRYIVLPSGVYARYLNDDLQPTSIAARYRRQINRAYFQLLLDSSTSETVAVFAESDTIRGGEIRILRLLQPTRQQAGS